MAAKGGRTEVLKLLIANGAELCVLNKAMDLPLHVCLKHGHSEFARVLIKILVE
jgi:ankyrin repeat protein